MSQTEEPDINQREDNREESQSPVGGGNFDSGNEQGSLCSAKAHEAVDDEATQYPGEAAIQNDRALLAAGQVQDSNLSLLSIASS